MKATQPKCYPVDLSDPTDSVNLGRSHFHRQGKEENRTWGQKLVISNCPP